MLNKIYIAVEGQKLKWKTNKPPIVADDSIQQVIFRFNIPNIIIGTVFTAQFTQNSTTYSILLNENFEAFLPNEIVVGQCSISLFGVIPGDTERFTSLPLVFNILQAGYVNGGTTPIPPTPDLYSQLLEEIYIKREGATYLPEVNALTGDLSWTNDKGLDNPETVNIRGPQGIQGIPGIDGTNGADGAKGETGDVGPNLVDITTATTLNGILKGNGTTVEALTIPEDPENKFLNGLQQWSVISSGGDAHKASHAIGGDDALTPADIGAVTLDELNAESYELIDLNNDVVIMNSHPDDWIIQENRFVSPVVNYVSGNMMASATFMDIGLSKGTYNVFVTTRTEGSGADMFRVQLGGRELPLLSIANTVNDECISVTVGFEQTLSFIVMAGAPYTTISPQMVFYIKKNVKGELTKINSRIDDMEELIPHNILDGGMDYSLRSRSSNQDHTQGYYSTQLGYETVSAGVSQTVIGEYNIIDGNFISKQPYHCAFMVGNGTSDTDRSNAMSVTWDGTVYAAKDFKVGTVSLVNHNSDTEKHVASVDKENWNSKQEQLVSGTNIKTLNNSSILGSGNIVLLDAYTSAQTGGYTDTLENFYLDLAAMQNLAATLEALL